MHASLLPALPVPLTPTELRVLRLLSGGLSYLEVATAAGVSINTVRTHVRAIYRKLDVDTKTEAVMQGLRRGLIQDDG